MSATKPRKYDPLRDHLRRQTGDTLAMTFDEVADLVGGLTRSAYEFPAWWANETSPKAAQRLAWQEADWRVQVNLQRRRVTFARYRP